MMPISVASSVLFLFHNFSVISLKFMSGCELDVLYDHLISTKGFYAAVKIKVVLVKQV